MLVSAQMLASVQVQASAQASEMAARPAWGIQVDLDLAVVLAVVHSSLLVVSCHPFASSSSSTLRGSFFHSICSRW